MPIIDQGIGQPCKKIIWIPSYNRLKLPRKKITYVKCIWTAL